MRKEKIRIVFIGLIMFLLFAFTGQEKTKLFLLGDSITLQYSPFLENILGDHFEIKKKAGTAEAFKNLDIPKGANGENSRMVLNYLKSQLADPSFHPDLMLLNCGLHDIKRDKQTNVIAIDSEEYKQNLLEISEILRQRNIRFIWVRTTEVVDSIHRKNPQFNRFAKDLDLYNSIADSVFKMKQVPVIDLYSITKKMVNQRYVDHVHYNDEVKKQQAAFIAGFIINLVKSFYINKLFVCYGYMQITGKSCLFC